MKEEAESKDETILEKLFQFVYQVNNIELGQLQKQELSDILDDWYEKAYETGYVDGSNEADLSCPENSISILDATNLVELQILRCYDNKNSKSTTKT